MVGAKDSKCGFGCDCDSGFCTAKITLMWQSCNISQLSRGRNAICSTYEPFQHDHFVAEGPNFEPMGGTDQEACSLGPNLARLQKVKTETTKEGRANRMLCPLHVHDPTPRDNKARQYLKRISTTSD